MGTSGVRGGTGGYDRTPYSDWTDSSLSYFRTFLLSELERRAHPTPRVPRAARKGGSTRSEARARGRDVAVSPVAFHGPNVTVSNFLPFEI